MIAQEWSRMKVAEKRVYIDMMRECKGEYVRKWTGARIPFVRKKSGRQPRDRTMPEPLANPFRAFFRENFKLFQDENPDFDYHQIKNLLEEVWDIFDEE